MQARPINDQKDDLPFDLYSAEAKEALLAQIGDYSSAAPATEMKEEEKLSADSAEEINAVQRRNRKILQPQLPSSQTLATILYSGCTDEKPDEDPQKYRKAFVEYIMRHGDDFPDREGNPHPDLEDNTTTMNALFSVPAIDPVSGKQISGHELYQRALAEEINSREYMNALLSASTKEYPSPKWGKPPFVIVAGPAFSDKRDAAEAALAEAGTLLSTSQAKEPNKVITVDETIAYEVSQMHKLANMVANNHGFSHIIDLEEAGQKIVKVAENRMYDYAVKDTSSGVVIPQTFSDYTSGINPPKALKDAENQTARIPIFTRITGNKIRHFATPRSWKSRDLNKKKLYDLNGENPSTIKTNKQHGYRLATHGAEHAEKYFKKKCRNNLSILITDDTNLYIETPPGSETWVQTRNHAGSIPVSAAIFKEWETSYKEMGVGLQEFSGKINIYWNENRHTWQKMDLNVSNQLSAEIEGRFFFRWRVDVENCLKTKVAPPSLSDFIRKEEEDERAQKIQNSSIIRLKKTIDSLPDSTTHKAILQNIFQEGHSVVNIQFLSDQLKVLQAVSDPKEARQLKPVIKAIGKALDELLNTKQESSELLLYQLARSCKKTLKTLRPNIKIQYENIINTEIDSYRQFLNTETLNPLQRAFLHKQIISRIMNIILKNSPIFRYELEKQINAKIFNNMGDQTIASIGHICHPENESLDAFIDRISAEARAISPAQCFQMDKNVTPLSAFGKSGHETWWAHATYVDGAEEEKNAVLKHNKKGKEYLSILEVGISAVWEQCLGDLTPQCDLVVTDSGETTGVISRKISGNIRKMESVEQMQNLTNTQKKEMARILTASYLLEEDDLHRANLIEVTNKQGEKHFVKIDHDMSFYDTVSSVSGNRRIYLGRIQDDGRFVVTPRDLMTFPVLRDANPHYWPTKVRPGIFGITNAETRYNQSFADAVACLADDPVFIQEKYRALLEYTRINPDSVRKKITERLGNAHPEVTSMLVNAFIVRQSEVKAVLLSVPNLASLFDLNNDEKQALSDNPLVVALKMGCLKFIEIEDYKNHSNTPDVHGKIPIEYAIKERQWNAVEILLQNTDTLPAQYDIKVIQDEIENYHKENRKNFLKYLNEKFDQHANDLALFARDELAIIRDCDKFSTHEKKQHAALVFEFATSKVTSASQLNNLLNLTQQDKFNFIKHLETRGWLTRQVRGMHGATSTYTNILSTLIKKAESMRDTPQNSLIESHLLYTFLDRANSLQTFAGSLQRNGSLSLSSIKHFFFPKAGEKKQTSTIVKTGDLTWKMQNVSFVGEAGQQYSLSRADTDILMTNNEIEALVRDISGNNTVGIGALRLTTTTSIANVSEKMTGKISVIELNTPTQNQSKNKINTAAPKQHKNTSIANNSIFPPPKTYPKLISVTSGQQSKLYGNLSLMRKIHEDVKNGDYELLYQMVEATIKKFTDDMKDQNLDVSKIQMSPKAGTTEVWLAMMKYCCEQKKILFEIQPPENPQFNYVSKYRDETLNQIRAAMQRRGNAMEHHVAAS